MYLTVFLSFNEYDERDYSDYSLNMLVNIFNSSRIKGSNCVCVHIRQIRSPTINILISF